MKQADRRKTVIQMLSIALLLCIIVGVFYLISGGRPLSWPGQLLSPLSPLSPLTTPTSLAMAPKHVPIPTPTASPQPAVPPPPIDLTVIQSNDTWGYLLPCG
ncbi:MAG: hypothetical protein JW850_11195 [Thermoflexales bacterium]|nr:hypothetical protein [Thermoflexales bacterium]